MPARWVPTFSLKRRPAIRRIPQSAERGSITFRINGPGSYVVAENNVTFNDIVSHWAKDEIEVAASRHITNGTGRADSRQTMR